TVAVHPSVVASDRLRPFARGEFALWPATPAHSPRNRVASVTTWSAATGLLNAARIHPVSTDGSVLKNPSTVRSCKKSRRRGTPTAYWKSSFAAITKKHRGDRARPAITCWHYW